MPCPREGLTNSGDAARIWSEIPPVKGERSPEDSHTQCQGKGKAVLLTVALHPAHGALNHTIGITSGIEPTDDLLGTLKALYASNEYLFVKLESLRRQVDSARAYLSQPGNNPLLGEALLSRLRSKHTGTLTLLRANRCQARELCGRIEAVPIAV